MLGLAREGASSPAGLPNAHCRAYLQARAVLDNYILQIHLCYLQDHFSHGSKRPTPNLGHIAESIVETGMELRDRELRRAAVPPPPHCLQLWQQKAANTDAAEKGETPR